MRSFFKKQEKPYPGEIEEAEKWPNAHVYRIKGHFWARGSGPSGGNRWGMEGR